MRRIPRLQVLGLALAGMIGLGRAAPLPLPDEAAARKLYVNKCAKCHKFYDPAKYSDAQWKIWMGKMSKKSKLTVEQEKLLSGYLEQRYRSPKKPGSEGTNH